MNFEYNWKNNEANFGPPITGEVHNGTHITVDILLKKDETFFALRRDCIPGHDIPPEGEKQLFLCHNLIRYGEPLMDCVERIVSEQAGVKALNSKVLDIRSFTIEESGGKDITQWAIIPFIIAEVDKKPAAGLYGNDVYEVVSFTKNNIPLDFAFGKTSFITKMITA